MSLPGKVFQLMQQWAAFRPALSACINDFLENELSQLANQYGSDKGPGGHNYTRIYASKFEALRGSQVLMLEVGLLKHSDQAALANKNFNRAPSICMWLDYFPNAKILGFDIADFSSFNAARCTILRGDQSSREDLTSVIAAAGGRKFDIIIDDALHAAPHQQITLATLLPHLADDGMYFIEDLHFDPLMKTSDDPDLTVNVLERFQRTGEVVTRWLSEEEKSYLKTVLGDVEFFESFRRDLVGRKCLASIKKRA